MFAQVVNDYKQKMQRLGKLFSADGYGLFSAGRPGGATGVFQTARDSGMIERSTRRSVGGSVPKDYHGMAADVRALTTYVKLLRAGEGVLREASRLLALYDLMPGQFGVLEALYEAGPQQPSVLAHRMLRTAPELNAIVGGLRKRRLVRRQPAGNKRASATIVLTPKGRNLVRSVLPGHGATIVSIMARLGAREQETLGNLCSKLGRPSFSPSAKPAKAPSRRARSRRR